MTWELKPARDAFPTFADEWDRLNRELYNSHPMFDSRFVGPLLEHFGQGDELLCIHRTSDAVDGALILRPLNLGRWALFLPAQAQIAPVLLRDVRLLRTLMTTLPGYAWSIDLLAQDPKYSPVWTELQVPRIVSEHALTMSVEMDSDFDHYWQSRPRHLVSNLRRYQRRTDQQFGAPSVVTITEVGEIPAAVARYAALESAGWKGEAGTAVEANAPQGRFYEDSLQAFASAGRARVIELYVSGQLAASRLIILSGQCWVMLKTAYDESLAPIAPGRKLLLRTLKQAFDEMHSGTIEFYTNATRDQAEWATSLRYIRHHQVMRSEIAAGLFELTRTIRKLFRKKNHRGRTDTFQPVTTRAYHGIDQMPESTAKLFAKAEAQCAEFSTGWFSNLEQTVFSGDKGIRYYVSELADKPTAILPIRLNKNGLVRSIGALGNYYTSLYSPILAQQGSALDLVSIIEAASRDHGSAHVIRFAPMDPESPAYEATITALRSSGWVPFRFFCFGNWFQQVEGSWKEYLEHREGQLRSTIKRKGKKFAAEGGTIEIVTDPAQVEDAIRNFNHVYSRSWKQPEPYPEFIPGLIRWLAARGWLRLGIARLNDQPVAAQLWIVAHGRASIFKLAHDEANANLGTGTILTALMMEHAIDTDHVIEIDYLIGDDPYKRQWMNRRRERWGIVAYNPRTLQGLALIAREVIGRTMRHLISIVKSSVVEHAFTWEIIPVDHFAEHTARWDALLLNLHPGIPFLESSFLSPLLEEFGNRHEMVAFCTCAGKPCAAAILTKTKIGVWQTFQPAQLPLGAWITDQTVNLTLLSKSLMRALPGFNVGLSITQLDPILMPRPADTGDIETLDYINTAWIDIDQTFDDYWESRGKNLKSNTRKQRSKLQAEGIETKLECIADTKDVAQAIQDYGSLESTGWKGQDGTAVHPDNAQGRFYRKMLENFCNLQRGRIYRYRFNDKVVAMDLCIEGDERIVILKTAYDESYKAVSPSTLMRQDEFRELFNEGKLKRIEFYGKVMEWHTRWTDNARAIYHVTSYRHALISSLHANCRKLFR